MKLKYIIRKTYKFVSVKKITFIHPVRNKKNSARRYTYMISLRSVTKMNQINKFLTITAIFAIVTLGYSGYLVFTAIPAYVQLIQIVWMNGLFNQVTFDLCRQLCQDILVQNPWYHYIFSAFVTCWIAYIIYAFYFCFFVNSISRAYKMK